MWLQERAGGRKAYSAGVLYLLSHLAGPVLRYPYSITILFASQYLLFIMYK